VGAVSFDKDAVYIDIGRVNYTKKENLVTGENSEQGEESDSDDDNEAPSTLLKNLQDVESGVDEKMKNSSLRIFKSSKAVNAESDEESDSDVESELDAQTEEIQRAKVAAEIEQLAKPFKQRTSISQEEIESSSSDDDTDDDDDSSSSEDGTESEDDTDPQTSEPSSALWKTNLAQKAAEAYIGREMAQVNLQELIYGSPAKNIVSEDEGEGKSGDDAEASDSDDDDFFKIRREGSSNNQKSNSNLNDETIISNELNENDSSRRFGEEETEFDVSIWLQDGEDCLLESLRDKFVTGNWETKEELVGDFEDLETGEKYGPNGEIDSDNEDDFGVNSSTDGMNDAEIREHNVTKKLSSKGKFDDEEEKSEINASDPDAENEYIDSLKREKEARIQRNKLEFGEEGDSARIRHEGFRQGYYCRIRIDGVPHEFLEAYDPNLPLVLGGLTPQETNRGFTRCRIKKHRWHKKILKCNDPLVFSVGWRRFQTIPCFSTEDQNGRHRYDYMVLIHNRGQGLASMLSHLLFLMIGI
jgi:ribosome biogenesis protein BMS1